MADSAPFAPPSWTYEPRSVQQAKQVAQLQTFKQQAAPLVNQPGGFSQAALQQLVDQQQQDPGQVAQQQHQSNQTLGGKIADFFRGAVPQPIRDVVGSALQDVSSPEKFLNFAQQVATNDPRQPWGAGTPGTLGTDVGNAIGGIPGVGGFARQVFDVGAAPASVATAAPLGVAKGLGAAIGGVLGQDAANKIVPEDANPLLRGAAQIGGGLVGGGLGAGLAGGVEAAAENPALRNVAGRLATEEIGSIRLPGSQPELPSNQPNIPQTPPPFTPPVIGAEPNAAPPAGLEPPVSSPAEAPLPAGETGQTPEGSAAGNLAAYQRSLSADRHPSLGRTGLGEAPPPPMGSPPSPLSTDPADLLKEAITNAKPLQQQAAESLHQFRGQQMSGFSGAFNPANATEEDFLRGIGNMAGQAERPTFAPLRDTFSQDQIDSIMGRIAGSPLPTGDQASAGTAFRDLLNGRVPTPSTLSHLEDVVPGLTEALQKANIVNPQTWRDYIPKNLSDVNNLIRSSNTILDFAAGGRLVNAFMLQPRTFMRAWRQGFASLKDQSVVEGVYEDLNARAEASGGQLPNVPTMREGGLAVGPGTAADTNPTLASKIPIIGKFAPWYRNFQNLLRPQMAQTEIENRIAADPSFAQRMADPAVSADLYRGINLVTGKSSFRVGDDMNLLVEFPNWLASQYELIGKGLTSGSITGDIARRSLVRLVGFGLTTTAALNMLQGIGPTDPRAFRHGVPMAHIPGTDLTIDMFGPLGELVSKDANVAGQIFTGAKTGGVGGAVGGGSQALFDLYRSLASPVAGIGIDLATGTNQVGLPTRNAAYLAQRVAPFAASGAIEGREPLAQALSTGGLRVHEPSTLAKLNDALQQQYGAPLKDLNPTQLAEARHDPQYQGLFDKLNTETTARAAGGEPGAEAVVARAKTDAQQSASDDELVNGQITRQQWLAQRADRLTKERGALEQIYGQGKPITAAQAAQDPKALYLQALQQAVDPQTGALDPLKLAQIRAGWTPQQNTQVDQATNTKGTPVEQSYRDAAAQYYGTPKYHGYSAEDGSAIDRAFTLITQAAQQLPGTNAALNRQRAFRQLVASGSLGTLTPAQQGGIRRLIAGTLKEAPQRQNMLRRDPSVQFWFGSHPQPGQRQQAVATLQALPHLAEGGVSAPVKPLPQPPLSLTQYAKGQSQSPVEEAPEKKKIKRVRKTVEYHQSGPLKGRIASVLEETEE